MSTRLEVKSAPHVQQHKVNLVVFRSWTNSWQWQNRWSAKCLVRTVGSKVALPSTSVVVLTDRTLTAFSTIPALQELFKMNKIRDVLVQVCSMLTRTTA